MSGGAQLTQLSAWATQFQRYAAMVASRWRHCARFDRLDN